MKHFSLVLSSCLLGLTLPLTVRAIDCVPTQSCPEGVEPPACCQPPPCEFFEQIKMKQAMKRQFSKPKLRKQLIRKAGGDNPAAARLLYEFVVKKAANLGSQLRCDWQGPLLPPPSFEVNESCQIVAVLPGGLVPMSRETALRELETCSEFIDAAYDHEQKHKDICFTTNSAERANEGIEVYAKEERTGYTQEISRLKADLQQYWNACSAVADAATKRQVAAAGISVLKKKSAKSGKAK